MALQKLKKKGKARPTEALVIEVEGEAMRFRPPSFPDVYVSEEEVMRVRMAFPGAPHADFYRDAVMIGRCYLPEAEDIRLAEEEGGKFDGVLAFAELAYTLPLAFVQIKAKFQETMNAAFDLAGAVESEKNGSGQ